MMGKHGLGAAQGLGGDPRATEGAIDQTAWRRGQAGGAVQFIEDHQPSGVVGQTELRLV